MISFKVDRKGVTLEYEPEFGGESWVTRELDQHGEVTLSRVFTFERSDLIAEDEHIAAASEDGAADDDIFADVDDGTVYRFRLATTKAGYHRIRGRFSASMRTC